MADAWDDRKAQETQMQKLLGFVQENEVVLKTIEEKTRHCIAEAPESHYRAIRLIHDSMERVHPQDLIYTENTILRKVISVIVFLCEEVRELVDIAETKMYRPLQMYGAFLPENQNNDDVAVLPGEREENMGRFMSFLQDLSNFIDRCYTVATNFIQQLASLMQPNEQFYLNTLQASHMVPAFQSLGSLFTVLITIDCIVDQNEVLKEHWQQYKSLISYARKDPSKFDTDESGIRKFERLLVGIDQTIMLGEVFKGCVEQNYECYHEEMGEIHVIVRNNPLFLKEMLYSIKVSLDECLAIIGTSNELFEQQNIVGQLALYALYLKLLPANVAPDTKIHKYMWEVQKTVPCVCLSDSVLWTVGEFLQHYAFFELKKLDPPNPAAYRRQYITAFDAALGNRCASLISQCKAWYVLAESRLQECVRHEADGLQNFMDMRSSILLKGLSLANRTAYLAKSSLVMHSSMQVPLSRTSLASIAALVENLKAIEFTCLRKDQAIQEGMSHMLRGTFQQIVEVMAPVIRKLDVGQNMDAARADLLSLFRICEYIVKVSDNLSNSRQYILTLTSHVISCSGMVPDRERATLYRLCQRAVQLANFSADLSRVCDSGFLYHHIDILEPVVQSVYGQPLEANRLQYVLAAWSDGIRVCQAVSHTDVSPYFIGYRNYLKAVLYDNVVQPLCRDIETNLRVHIHTKNLDHLETINPKTSNVTPLRPFLDLPPLRVLGLRVDIKHEVKHYLDTNFYNLTTVALHDWRTYADMRNLCQEKFGLELMDNFLPMGSLDQGLDVLQIMRNIHIFVSRFSYNMNMQQFVEFKPDKSSKHINVIKIQSIAASIRQHGLGVLNTTVNYTYQFLTKKFHIFNQFLFDDYIRAHLSRERRWYHKNKHAKEVDNCYPYERAKKFAQDIRKLGVDKNGKSYLDQFRMLITEIGNALGYVRMVRSAGMYFCSEAVKFLPDFENVISFEEYAGDGPKGDDEEEGVKKLGANFSPETVRAGKNLDAVIDTLVKNFGEGSDYFKVLVSVFQGVLLGDKSEEHDHLKAFHMIVPALCISWIDASLQSKDNMFKVNRGSLNREIYFTDDGFAMGVAYCLAILKLTKRFESLHWVDTVRQKHKVDSKNLAKLQATRDEKERLKAAKNAEKAKRKTSFFGFKKKQEDEEEEEIDYEEEEEIHLLQVSGKKLEAVRRESEQLFYSLSGAGIFFKRTDVDI